MFCMADNDQDLMKCLNLVNDNVLFDQEQDPLFYVLNIFFSIDVSLHIHLSNIKTLSPGTHTLGVPGKNTKNKFLSKKSN